MNTNKSNKSCCTLPLLFVLISVFFVYAETKSPLVCHLQLEITEPVRKNIIGSRTSKARCTGNFVCASLFGRSTSQLQIAGHPTVNASYKGPYVYNYQGCLDQDECLNLCQQVNSTRLRVKGSALSCTRRCCTTDECNTRIAVSKGSSQNHSLTMLGTSLFIVLAAEKGFRWMLSN